MLKRHFIQQPDFFLRQLVIAILVFTLYTSVHVMQEDEKWAK
ncbi:MAG: hypothetical protein ABIN36_19950 [Ferruginibacter sp.]